MRRRYLGFSIGPGGVVYHVRGVVYYVTHGREVKKEICDWPDGVYELAPAILTCDLYLHFKCKMDCTFFFFASFRRKTNILIYTNIGQTHEIKKRCSSFYIWSASIHQMSKFQVLTRKNRLANPVQACLLRFGWTSLYYGNVRRLWT